MRSGAKQSCKWNERSLNRGLNRGRGLGSDETFFWASCSNLQIDENFRISHNLGLGLAAKISQAFAIQSRSLSRPKHTPPNCPPPKESLFGVFPCTLRRTCGVDIGYISHILRKSETISRDSIYKCLWGPGIDKEWISPAYVSRAGIFKGTEAEFIPWNRFLGSINILKYCLWGEAMRGGGGTQTEYIVNLCVVVLLAESAIFQGALFSRDLFLMHKCLNRDHHSCDKPLKAKVFFILYPSRAV